MEMKVELFTKMVSIPGEDGVIRIDCTWRKLSVIVVKSIVRKEIGVKKHRVLIRFNGVRV
jgi:hypothetical protein